MSDEQTRGTILDTPEQIELFRLLQMKYALRIEIRTGMTHSRGSVMNLISRVLMDLGRVDKPFRRKQAAYDALDEYIGEKEQAMLEDPA